MAITAAGVGSGLDIEGIVSQLMQLERRPLEVLEQRESDTREELSAYGRLKSAISTFKSAMDGLSDVEEFQVYAATSSDQEVLSAAADSGAAKGVFSIDVQRLAQNHKVSSGEFADSTEFGTAGDTLSISVGSETMELGFGGSVTLAELRDAINDADDNPGVTASILNTGGGNQRLILTSQESGAENQMSLAYSGSISGNPFGFAPQHGWWQPTADPDVPGIRCRKANVAGLQWQHLRKSLRLRYREPGRSGNPHQRFEPTGRGIHGGWFQRHQRQQPGD